MKLHNDKVQKIGAELGKSIDDGFKSLVDILARMLSAIYNQHVAGQKLDPTYNLKQEQSLNEYQAHENNSDGRTAVKEEKQEQNYIDEEIELEDNQKMLIQNAAELFEDDSEEYNEGYLEEYLEDEFAPGE